MIYRELPRLISWAWRLHKAALKIGVLTPRQARALRQVTDRVLALRGPAILDVDQH